MKHQSLDHLLETGQATPSAEKPKKLSVKEKLELVAAAYEKRSMRSYNPIYGIERGFGIFFAFRTTEMTLFTLAVDTLVENGVKATPRFGSIMRHLGVDRVWLNDNFCHCKVTGLTGSKIGSILRDRAATIR